MSEQDMLERFEELEAGRILGDLSNEEMAEWQNLSDAHGLKKDFSLELAAAAIQTDFIQSHADPLPADLAKSLRQTLPRQTPPPKITPSVENPKIWQRIFRSPQAAWGIAAVFAVLLAISFIGGNSDSGTSSHLSANPSPKEALERLRGKAGDLIESEFGGTESYGPMSGNVVWSDEMQEGYMTLTDLPANDPSKKQYQLWIIDPARDENPVDGGVFDIPSGESTSIIPIRNPLFVTKPQAFVITLEQPGGVVVSKQEVVVALAKAS